MEVIHDIAIIGGGPAGTSAAITAARAGARVLLLERGGFPRQKVCGEFVSSESLELLRSLFHGDSGTNSMLEDAVRISSARTFVDGQVIETEIAPAAFSIPRYEMDAALWQKALSLGVEGREQVTVSKIIRTPGSGNGNSVQPELGFTLETASQRFFARAVINASGRWSNFKAATTPIPAGPKWIGVKMHFAETNPNPALELYFFKGGYCGISPIGNGHINACAMVRADIARTMAEVLRCDPRLSERSRNWKPVTAEVSTAPLVFHAPSIVVDDVLLAGDAAGFIDPFVGDGISMALHSGAMAANALIANLYQPAAAAVAYQSEYGRRLLPAFRNAARIRRLMRLPPLVRWPMVKAMQMLGVSELMLKSTRARVAQH